MSFPFFTIGHSTRSISEFVNLLTNAGVQLVADVRAVPRSHTNPQGAALFGHAAMLRAVEERTQQERLEQMDAARDVEEPYQPGLADRQRRNLAEFNDVAELVRAWRALRT